MEVVCLFTICCAAADYYDSQQNHTEGLFWAKRAALYNKLIKDITLIAPIK